MANTIYLMYINKVATGHEPCQLDLSYDYTLDSNRSQPLPRRSILCSWIRQQSTKTTAKAIYLMYMI